MLLVVWTAIDLQPNDSWRLDHATTGAPPHPGPPKTSYECPFRAFGCAHIHSQQERMCTHINDEHGTLPADIRRDTLRRVRNTPYDLCQFCDVAYSTTQSGANKHKAVCTPFRNHVQSLGMLRDGVHDRQGAPGPLGGIRMAEWAAPTTRREGDRLILGRWIFTVTEWGHQVDLPGRQDYNCCLYLCCARGDPVAALDIKACLAPLASALSNLRGGRTRFQDQGVLAEEEVLRSYAHHRGPIIVVELDRPCPHVYGYVRPGNEGARPAMVVRSGNHFTQLGLADNTCTFDELALARPGADANNTTLGEAPAVAASGTGSSEASATADNERGASDTTNVSPPTTKAATDAGAATRRPQTDARQTGGDANLGAGQSGGSPDSRRRPTNRLTIVATFDGGSRGNPGLAGAGATVSVRDAETIWHMSDHAVFVHEWATNNIAEYHGCIKALQAVSQLAVARADMAVRFNIIIKGDSMLVIRQLEGRWKCSDESLVALQQTAQQIVLDLERDGHTVTFEHVERQYNRDADRQANKAMDDRASSDTWAASREAGLRTLSTATAAGPEAVDLAAPWRPHPRAKVPRLSTLPTAEGLRNIMATLHEASRPLAHLPPTKLWPRHLTLRWTQACTQFRAVLRAALDGEDELRLMQTTLDLLELPTLHLLDEKRQKKDRHTQPDPVETSAAGDPRLNKAKKLVYMDLPAKAMQAILSNGVASATAAVLQILTDMHPARRQDQHKHEPRGAQVTVTAGKAQQFLYARASSDTSAICCFGWTAAYLLPLRGLRAHDGTQPFIHELARLVARIASAEIPESLADVLTTGSLFALHKLSKEQQLQRTAAGLPPEIRPVNVGCAVLRWGLKLALQSKQAQATAKQLQPLQMGLATRGVERVAHLYRALHARGYLIMKTDFKNGFNALRRGAMLDAVHKRCPAMGKLFNLFYARDATCFFMVDDKAQQIMSTEGSRMGCSLGSFGFDLAVHGLYEELAARFPHAVISCLTDDVTVAIPLHACEHRTTGQHTPDVNAQQFRQAAEIFDFIESRAMALCGLELRRNKCCILLPGQAACCTDQLSELPTGVEVTRDGTRAVRSSRERPSARTTSVGTKWRPWCRTPGPSSRRCAGLTRRSALCCSTAASRVR